MGAFDDSRPNPDQVLGALTKTQARASKGRLKIYLGMAAGVGKTFAMLRGAHELVKHGRSVLVGIVETHGRAETVAALGTLPVLARRKSSHEGVLLQDFDLDAAIQAKPDVLLLDELAHTNAPGGRHSRRWQDVLELLEAGIDVHTTLNVQHLESRADSVESMTAIKVTETVPDSLLDLAHEIVVIDLDPHALIDRLKEGKIYPAERIQTASENFFRPENLTALREIALRVTAERVDQDLQTIHKIHHPKRPWRASERLLVAVYASPYSEIMIRRTRLLAATLDAPWFGAYVDSGKDLSEEEKGLLSKNLSLVRELGGEVLTTLDMKASDGLLRLCRENNITQIVVGKSRQRGWPRFFSRTPTEELLREAHPVDIYVVSSEKHATPLPRKNFDFTKPAKGRLAELVWMAVFLALTMLLSRMLIPVFDYRAIGLIFLVPTLLLSLFARPKVIWLCTLISALLWDYFFMPPFHTFSLQHDSDYLLLGLFFIVSTVTGFLTSRLRKQRGILEIREQRALVLYRLSKALATADSVGDIQNIARTELGRLVGSPVLLFVRDKSEDKLERTDDIGVKEAAVAEWVLKNGKPAGRYTDTLPASEGSYFPLLTQQSTWGVLALVPAAKRLNPETRILVESVCGQVALALQKERLRDAAKFAELSKESERLSRSLLNVVSHELKTPITAILSASSSLKERSSPRDTREVELLESVEENGRRLTRIVDHILETNRLESGHMQARHDPVDVKDVIDATLRRLESERAQHAIEVVYENEPRFIHTDEIMLGTILRNLVHNALFHTPPQSRIYVKARFAEETLEIRVQDEGHGFSPGDEEKIFERFYRAPHASAGGSGLGLALARGLAEALGGSLSARNLDVRGAEFLLKLPVRRTP